MCSDYDNPFGMSDSEFEYRAMNPQDPMYMGDTNKAPYGVDNYYSAPKKKSQKTKKKENKKAEPQQVYVYNGMSESTFLWLFFLVCMLFILGLIWLFS